MVWKLQWNPVKAEENYRKHGVRFEEAEVVFRDPHAVVFDDSLHSDEEDRYFVVGESAYSRLLIISYTIRDDYAWVISARRASRAERRRFMRGDEIRDRPIDDSDETINFDDIPEIFDFSKGIRGLHYIPMTVTRVSIADDVAEVFRTDNDVNDALRLLINEGRLPPYRY